MVLLVDLHRTGVVPIQIKSGKLGRKIVFWERSFENNVKKKREIELTHSRIMLGCVWFGMILDL